MAQPAPNASVHPWIIAAVANPDEAETVIPWAALLARPLARPVLLAYILDPGKAKDEMPVAAVVAHDLLLLCASDERFAGVEVETRMEVGLADEELPRLANGRPGALLVVAGGDKTGVARAILANNDADAAIRALRSPFIVIPPGSSAPAAIRRVVVGTDRSELAESVLARARPLADAFGVEVITAEVLEPGAMPLHEYLNAEPELGPTHLVLRGRAGATLLAVARAHAADMIMVGSTGRGAMSRMLLGSTASWLARNSDRPVLVVPRVER